MYFWYTTNLITSQKNQPLLFAVFALKKIWRQIRGAPWKNIHPKYLILLYHKFDYKLENLPSLFAQGGCLKEKIGRQIRGAPWTNMWEVACYFEYKFLNFDNHFFYHPKDLHLMYHKFNYMSKKSTLIICTRWLPWRENR